MGLLIRTFLIWLLMLAVPAQGVAASTLAFCGPQHHGGSASAHKKSAAPANQAQPFGSAGAQQKHEQKYAHDQHHDHSHGYGHSHAHDQPHATAVAGADPAAASGSPASAEAKQANTHKCSACATCCSVSAMLNSAPAVPTPVFTSTVFSTLVPGVETFAADGPERPPRPFLA